MTLRAALEVLWAGNGSESGSGIAMAQTILDAADITLPTGDLANGAYDAFGAAYGMPEWVVADPENIVKEEIDIDADKGAEGSEGIDEVEVERRREEKGKAVIAASDMLTVRARLSVKGGADVVVNIGKKDSVRLLMKRIVEEAEVRYPVLYDAVYLLVGHNSRSPWTDTFIASAFKTDQDCLPRFHSQGKRNAHCPRLERRQHR